MKIIQLTTQWKGTVGGPSNYVFNLSENLRIKKFDVFIFSRHEKVNSTKLDCDVRYLPPNYIVSFFFLIRNFFLLKPGVIHVHGSLKLLIMPLFYKFIFVKNVKVVFTFHTQPTFYNYFQSVEISKSPYFDIESQIGNLLLKYCDCVTSVSKSIIDNLNNYTGLKIGNAKVIYSGFKPQSLVRKCTLNKDDNFASNGPIIVTTGVFSWDWKVVGHILLIRSIYELKKDFPFIKLYILGDGFYRYKIENVIDELGLIDNVILKGNVSNVYEFLIESDVYAHFGLNEGSPLALVEAMAVGCPIIAARSGGIPEVLINNSGILVYPNVIGIVNGFKSILLDANLRSEIGVNAMKLAFDTYTWEKITDNYINVYSNEK